MNYLFTIDCDGKQGVNYKGSQCAVACADNYELNGANSLTCQKNDDKEWDWDSAWPSCDPGENHLSFDKFYNLFISYYNDGRSDDGRNNDSNNDYGRDNMGVSALACQFQFFM